MPKAATKSRIPRCNPARENCSSKLRSPCSAKQLLRSSNREVNTMRSAILLIVCMCLALLASRGGAAETAASPNIVLLFIDDMGYGDIGPFGNTKVKTPHLDKFAAEGMKFTSFYATPVCSMSRACLMTGCYNARVSIPGVLFPGSQIGLHSDEVTLAEVVKQKG